MRLRHLGALRSWCAVLGGAALIVVIALPPSVATGASTRSGTGLSTNYDFARLVLRDGGWPTSPNNVTVLTQWLRAEEPISDWWDRDNPLNNGLGSGGGSGLGSTDSLVIAAHDVAQNLENPAWGYPRVAGDLASSSTPAMTARAIWRSNWAAGHYGWGADWDTAPVASVAAPPAAWRDPVECTAAAGGVVTTCAAAFKVTGSMWHWAPLSGTSGNEVWAFASRKQTPGVATWQPKLVPGSYDVDALVPSQFADAVASYVVADARGGHRVVVDQEPYRNAWVQLGEFTAGTSTPISVALRTRTTGSAAGTYLAASDMRFTPAGSSRSHAGHATPGVAFSIGPPGAPQDVTGIAANGRAVVSWLAPSKNGGDPVTAYRVTALPGGHACEVTDVGPAAPSCTVAGLTNGTSYRFVVRATTPAGTGPASSPSPPACPLQPTTMTMTTRGTQSYGDVVVYRATLHPEPTSGLVLFAVGGMVLPGCGSATVVKGHASCAVRLTSVGSHQLLVSFSGSGSSSGAESVVDEVVTRSTTELRASVDPISSPESSIVRVIGSGLPGEATGAIVFTAGHVRLCATAVRSGGGSCRFRLRLDPGVHLVVATYDGSREFVRTSARTSLRVLVTPTT